MKKTALLILTLFLLSGTSKVFSQEKSSSSLGISPPVIEINSKIDNSPEAQITIQNQTSDQVSLGISYKSFRLKPGSNGEIQYINSSTLDNYLFNRIKVFDSDNEIQSVNLNPYEAKNLKMKINVDSKLENRDYYFSVIFISKDINKAGTIGPSIGGGIGTNVILSVQNDNKPQIEVKEFSAPLFLASGPVPITLLLNNIGSKYALLQGKIEIKNMFGRNVASIDLLPQYLPAGSERYLLDSKSVSTSVGKHNIILWPERFILGVYTARLNLQIDDKTQVTQTISFIALPIYTIFALSFIFFVIIAAYIKAKNQKKSS